jgi:hypothetical protein
MVMVVDMDDPRVLACVHASTVGILEQARLVAEGA